jgi:hypothetical protein
MFPGVTASVGSAVKEVGGHWNFSVQLQFPSYCAANAFYSAYSASAANGWPALHLENLGNWSVSGCAYSVSATAHVDLYNPNATSQGGGGAGGIAGHVGIDFIIGHFVQALGSNIDPANCPWGGKTCTKGPPCGCP